MAKKIINQTSFTAGEVSPRIYSRSDADEFKRGLETATNTIVTPHGPIKRRNGTKFIAEVKDSSKKVKLVKYQFSKDLAFILEFGNTYIRFFKNGGQVLESNLTITGITKANPGVVTSTSHGLSNGDHVYITSVVGMTEVNSSTVPYLVANKAANTFELQTIGAVNVDTSAFTTYSSGGVINRIYQITSPYSDTQVKSIQYRPRGDTLYIVHPDFAPRKLIRTADTNWTLSQVTFLPIPTFESGFTATGFSMTPSATTGVDINFTSSSAVFLAGDVGRQIINLSTGEVGRASITSITSTTVAVCDIVEDFTNTDAIASADWKMDLSPVVDLEIDNLQAGAIANIRSEHTAGSLGSRFTITGVTAANPGVVTTSAAHGYVDGDSVQIQDILGMTEINDKIFTINQTGSTTFELNNEDTTNFTAYSSAGIARKKLDDTAIDAFRAADVNKYILINGGVMQILTVNSANDVDAEVIKTLNSTTTTGNWSLEVDTWDSTRGFPRAVGLYEQRLVFGGTTAQPQTIWFSEIGIFEGFGIGPDNEDSIEIDLVSNQVNEISWIFSTRDLVVGTSGGELTINSGSNSTSITPSNIQQQPRSSHGSSTQQVTGIREEILFIQNSNRKARTFRYSFELDGYVSEDLTYLAEHITEGGIDELAYAQEPDTIMYVVTTNGDLLAATYDRGKLIIAWCKHTTDGSYENIQTISRGEIDEVWVTINRTINGNTKRYIELLDSSIGEDDTDGFSDSYLTLSTPLTITNITAANPAVVTSAAHGLANGATVTIKDLVDPIASSLVSTKTNMSSLNQCIFTVANQATNTFELTSLNTSAYNAYGSAGNAFKRVTALSGLDHLEGSTVQVKGDGGIQADKTVSSGAITADTAAGEFVVGLEYVTTIKTLNHEFDIGLGSMQGQRARWARPLLRVFKSAKPTLNGEFLPSRSAANLTDKRIPLFSGFLEYGSLNWDNTSALTISLSDPLPLEISGVSGVIDSGVK